MLILPVWIQGWQIGCCGEDHEARIGRPWREVLLLAEIDEWAETDDRTLEWRRVPDGRVEFVANAIPSPKYGSASVVLDLGACRLGAPNLISSGFIEGRGKVSADWHGGMDPDRVDEAKVEGLVRRISIRRHILEQRGGREFWIIGHEPPVDVASTKGMSRSDTTLDVLLELGVAGT